MIFYKTFKMKNKFFFIICLSSFLTFFYSSSHAIKVNNAIIALENLGTNYDITLCPDNGNQPNPGDCPKDEYFYSTLKNSCIKAKEETTACCEDPNKCSPPGMSLAKYLLVLSPPILATINQYKTSKKVQNSNWSNQKKADTLCSAKNNMALAGFTSNLMLQLLPLLEKNCTKRIQHCKKTCNQELEQFKIDFRRAYQAVIPKRNINNTVKLAKHCLFGDENTSFDDIKITVNRQKITVKNNNNTIVNNNTIQRPPPNSCHLLNGKIKKNSFLPPPPPLKNKHYIFLSHILWQAKTYYNTMKDKDERFFFNEKEIVNCAKQPNRIVSSSQNNALGPISPVAIEICNQVAQESLTTPSSPPPPYPTSQNPPILPGGLGSLSGTTIKKTRNHPLLPQAQNETPDDDGWTPDGDGIPDPKPAPLATKVPSFTSNGGNGNPGGNGGGSSAGGLSGNSAPDTDDEDDPYYDYGGSENPAGYFPQPGGYNSANQGSENNRDGFYNDREIASDEDDEEAGDVYPDDEPLDELIETTIFDTASKNIQSFCSNLLECSI